MNRTINTMIRFLRLGRPNNKRPCGPTDIFDPVTFNQD